MIIEYCKKTNKYVSNVMCNTNNVLSWDAGSEDVSFIIIRTNYGKDLNLEESSIENILNKCTTSDFDSEIEISSDLSVILYNRISLIGFKCPCIPARYYIFVCDFDNESNSLRIHVPDYSYSYVDVGDTISFSIQIEIQQKKGIFAKLKGNSSTRKYISVRLNGECPIGYKNGDLYYSFQNINYIYPITRLMMKNGFSVPLYDDESSFSIRSSANGYNALINKRN